MSARITGAAAKAVAAQYGLAPKTKAAQKRAAPAILFEALCAAHGLQEPVGEFVFAPPRKWRWDWCWPEAKLALEIQGGLFVQGRHSRGAALLKEHEKLNEGAILGYRVIFCTPKDVKSGAVFALLKRALRRGERSDSLLRTCQERQPIIGAPGSVDDR